MQEPGLPMLVCHCLENEQLMLGLTFGPKTISLDPRIAEVEQYTIENPDLSRKELQAQTISRLD